MKIEVAGQLLQHNELGVRELGFGRPLDRGALPCTIELTFDEFIAVWEPIYTPFKIETQRDVASGNEPDPRYLHDAGYPDSTRLIGQYPEVLKQLFLEYLKFDLFQGWLGLNAHDPGCKFVLNDVDAMSVDVARRWVTLLGEAYAIVRPSP